MPSEKSLLCSAHFISDFFTQSDSSKRRLKKEAIPTIFPSYPSYLQITIPKKRRELKRKIVDQTKNQVSAPKKQKTALDIVELDHNYCISNAEALNTKLQQETERKNIVSKKLRSQREENKKLKETVTGLQDIVSKLKQRRYLSFCT